MNNKRILIGILVIFVVGMTFGVAFVELIDAKTVKKGKYIARKKSDKYNEKSYSYAN